MFENLLAEMARKKLSMMDLSKDKELDLSYTTLRNKFNGDSDWLRKEMFIIKKKYFPDKSIEYLFKQTQPQPIQK